MKKSTITITKNENVFTYSILLSGLTSHFGQDAVISFSIKHSDLFNLSEIKEIFVNEPLFVVNDKNKKRDFEFTSITVNPEKADIVSIKLNSAIPTTIILNKDNFFEKTKMDIQSFLFDSTIYK